MKFIINQYQKYKEVFWYLVVGGITTVFNFGIYMLSRIMFGTTTSYVIAWVAAVILAYFLNKIVVFQSAKSDEDILEGLTFFGFRLLTCGIGYLLFEGLLRLLLVPEPVAKLLAQFIEIALNYVFSKFFIFTKKENLTTNI